jgi:hypothetical protein
MYLTHTFRALSLFFLGLLSTVGGSALAQDARIEITYERGTDGEYRFSARNPNACEYTVRITFSQLQELSCSCSLPYEGSVPPGGGMLFTLKPSNPQARTNFQYAYTYSRGRALKTAPKEFVYLLPVGVGKSTTILPMQYVGELLGKATPTPFYATGFRLQPGDTVFAARRGRVVGLRNNTDPVAETMWYTSETNFVEVFHADGTFAKYDKLKKSDIWVREGDFVEAGQLLGRIGGENLSAGPRLAFQVYYLPSGQLTSTERRPYQTVQPRFCAQGQEGGAVLTTGQTYAAAYPESILAQELSKRELKKRKK